MSAQLYGYDAVGNRTGSQHQPGICTYNRDNQLTQYPRTIGPTIPGSATEQTSVTYTPQGNPQKESSEHWQRSYTFDEGERLIEIQQCEPNSAPITIRYRYDPYGRRIAKSVTDGATTKTTYFINGENAVMAEADGNGQITQAYGFNPDTQGDGEQDLWSTDPIWVAQASQGSLTQANFHYLETDHLGTPILAVNPQGEASWRGYSEAFGNTGIAPSSTLEMNLRFPGQYYDREIQLTQNGHRDYNAITGRYVQADPIGLRGGVNLYGYVEGDPLQKTDPLGLKTGPASPNIGSPNSRGPTTCSGNDCVEPPTGTPPHAPPKDPKAYSCADIAPSFGACLACCAARSPQQYMDGKQTGGICAE